MKKNTQFVAKAQSEAINYGWPGRNKGGTPKTGTFTGYHRSGKTAWHGKFDTGVQVGLWSYMNPQSTSDVVFEFYCNL
jgi:hypothetical protein